MVVPDGLVWASVPVLAAAGAKAGQWFVQDVLSQNKKNNRINAEIDNPAPSIAPHSISLRDFKQIAEAMKAELNGRYMLATEARSQFARMEHKIDEQSHDLKDFIKQNIGKAEQAL